MYLDPLPSQMECAKHIPGDLVVQMHPEWKDVRVIASYLTQKQREEYLDQRVCVLCGRPCAGTCQQSP